MEEKRVVTIEEIVFEKAGITLPKGTVYTIESVAGGGIILISPEGERLLIDLQTFEAGFAIAP